MFEPTISDTATAEEIRGHLKAAADEIVNLRRQPHDKRGASYEDDMRSAMSFIDQMDPVEEILDKTERAAAKAEAEKRAADEIDRIKKLNLRGPTAAGADLTSEPRSPGEEFVLSPGYEEFRAGGASGVYGHEVRALIQSGDTTTGIPEAGIWRPIGQPTLRPGAERRLRLFVRDLLSTGTTGLSSVPYIRELNAVTNETGALTVAEGSAKPEVTMEFVQADAPVRKIAAWLPATNEILSDAPTLRSYIDSRLEYMILLREEQQILSGTGTAPQLEGVTVAIGHLTQAAIAGDVPATFAESFADIENVDGEVDGVAMNPSDFWTAARTRHATQFDSGFGGNAPAEMSSITWGVPVVRTRALTALTAVSASWFMGATLLVREGVNIRVGDQHSDYFTTNKVAILGEERVALPIHRPDFFNVVTLAHS